MYEGRVTATYPKDEADERTLGLAMAGGAAPVEVGD
jgi:simple sugar transport system ATP-binding protein